MFSSVSVDMADVKANGVWLGLLKWSLAYSDGTVPSQVSEMSVEDRAFLENVMKEYAKDEPNRQSEIIQRFTEIIDAQSESEVEEELGMLLDELRYMIEQIDMAKVFTKFGGLTCILCLLRSPRCSQGNREMAGSIIAALAQNNIQVQDLMWESKTLESLCSIFFEALQAKESSSLLAKIIFALSAVVRGHAAAEATLVCGSLVSIIASVLQSSDLLLLRRGILLCKVLTMSDTTDATRTHLIASLVLPHCLAYITLADVDLREGTILLLSSLFASPGKSCLKQYMELIQEMVILRAETTIADSSFTEQEEREQALIAELKKIMDAMIIDPDPYHASA